jgi:hypothetical protein
MTFILKKKEKEIPENLMKKFKDKKNWKDLKSTNTVKNKKIMFYPVLSNNIKLKLIINKMILIIEEKLSVY